MPDFSGDAEGSTRGKNALRSRLLAARRSTSTPDRLAAAASLQAVLLSVVRAQHRPTIAGYVPVGTEPGGADLPDVLINALPSGGRLLLPVLLDDGDLDWVTYTGVLTPGPRGLLQPDGPRLGVDAVRTTSLLVVPALAVSRTGVRLGRGGGSYDRVLARLSSLPPVDGSSPARPSRGGPASHPEGLPHLGRVSASNPPLRPGPSYRPASSSGEPASSSGGVVPPDETAIPHSAGPWSTVGPLTVALLHDGELLDDIPAEPHDRAVHAVITPSGGLTLTPPAAA